MKNPTRLELQDACNEAYDFISTNMNGADVECQNKYAETMRILAQFRKTAKLSRYKKPTQGEG